ncbi:MAG: hypothetical protein M5U01_41145 [Ardenticatenaceae bacterium]|nr:hypothetical protein [Ardenticatenaceae bacterium]
MIRANGALVHPGGVAAVASGGDLIVYPSEDGPHDVDLWAIRRREEPGGAPEHRFGAPVLLTANSPYAFNGQPAIIAEGNVVVFECGDEPYGAEGTALCEAATDGTDFRVVLTPNDSPAGLPHAGALHHPDYAPDGSIVFAADWDGRIWRLPGPDAAPFPVAPQFEGDDSPCVLPDGRIASLWWNRPGGPGSAELKVMAADGSQFRMVLTGVDVAPAGIGCGS